VYALRGHCSVGIGQRAAERRLGARDTFVEVLARLIASFVLHLAGVTNRDVRVLAPAIASPVAPDGAASESIRLARALDGRTLRG
jgi:hypothetical protein